MFFEIISGILAYINVMFVPLIIVFQLRRIIKQNKEASEQSERAIFLLNNIYTSTKNKK